MPDRTNPPPPVYPNVASIAYERIETRDGNGTINSSQVTTPLDEKSRYYAVSPTATLAHFPDRLLDQQIEVVEQPDGTVRETRRLFTRPNISASARRFKNLGALEVGPRVHEERDRAALEETQVRLSIQVRGVPSIDIPPMASGRGYAPTVEQELETERQQIIEARQTEIASLMQPIVTWLENTGATVTTTNVLTGHVQVLLKPQSLEGLIARSDVRRVRFVEPGEPRDNCDSSCSQPATEWQMGYGRHDGRLDIDRFHAAGYRGDRDNPGFNPRLQAAVMERSGEESWEDEAQFLSPSTFGDYRISERRLCVSSGGCPTVSNFDDVEGSPDHPVNVFSVIASDLQNFQGAGQPMNDPCYPLLPSFFQNHCPDWNEMSSGMAPGAHIQMWANVENSNRSIAILAALLTGESPDVIHFSTSQNDCLAPGPCGPTACNPASQLPDEDMIEIAHSVGVLVVNGPSNNGNGNGTGVIGCGLDSPGDIPSTFTVGAFDSDTNPCGNYGTGDCPIRPTSPLGGADLTINGSSAGAGAMTGIDLVAPGQIRYFGIEQDQGSIDAVGLQPFGGTSAAAPHVSGAALVLKHWALDKGHEWINDPGRLHTVMLAMQDRDQNMTQRATGASNRWGLGKLKMRLFEPSNYLSPWGYSMRTNTQTSTGTETLVPFSMPVRSGAEIVKCVMHEHEYMANKTDVGDAYMTVRLVPPNATGECETSSNTDFSRVDATYDLKHMVAIENDTTTLAGKCLNVDIHRWAIATSGTSTANVFCYYASRNDNE